MAQSIQTFQKDIIRILGINKEERSEKEETKLVNYLSDCKVFKSCLDNIEKVKEIIDKGHLIKFNEKEVIFKRGDASDSFYIILFGTVSLTVSNYNEITEEDYQLPVKDLHDLEIFGHLEITYKMPRLQTVTVNRTAYCLKYSSSYYTNHLNKILIGDIEKRLQIFIQAPYFKDLDMHQIVTLSMKSSIVQFQSKQVVFTPFQTPRYIYFILSGQFQVLQEKFIYLDGEETKKIMQIDILKSGDYFGHIPILNHKQNQINIIGHYIYSLMPAECLKIHRHDIINLSKTTLNNLKLYLPEYPDTQNTKKPKEKKQQIQLNSHRKYKIEEPLKSTISYSFLNSEKV